MHIIVVSTIVVYLAQERHSFASFIRKEPSRVSLHGVRSNFAWYSGPNFPVSVQLIKLGQSVNMEPTVVRTGSPLSVSRVPFPSSVFRFRAPFSVFLFRVPCFVSAFRFPFLLPVSMFSSPCPFPCVSVFAPRVRCPCSVSVSRVRCPFPLSVRGKILSKPCRARWTDLYKSRNRHNSSNS